MTPRRFPPPWTVDEHAEANDDAIEATTTAIRRAARPADLIKDRVVRRQNAKRFAFDNRSSRGFIGRHLAGPCGFNQSLLTDGRRFFFLSKLEVMPRNLSVMVANFLDQCAVSKP